MQGTSLLFSRLTEFIPLIPTYPTEIRFLSLTDICIHYLIHNPKIPITFLPIELQEHIERRKVDSKYRVLPEYSADKYLIFKDGMTSRYHQLDLTCEKDNRLAVILDMLTLKYCYRFGDVVRDKLIRFPIEDSFLLGISRYYLVKWFDYRREEPPIQQN